jgi:hypothetical protein
MSFDFNRPVPPSQLPNLPEFIDGVAELLADLSLRINRLQDWPPFTAFCNHQLWHGKTLFPELACQLVTSTPTDPLTGIQTGLLESVVPGDDLTEAGDRGPEHRWIVGLNTDTGSLFSGLTYTPLLLYLAEAEGALFLQTEKSPGNPIKHCEGWYHDKQIMLETLGSYLEAQEMVLPALLGLDTRIGFDWTKALGPKLATYQDALKKSQHQRTR